MPRLRGDLCTHPGFFIHGRVKRILRCGGATRPAFPLPGSLSVAASLRKLVGSHAGVRWLANVESDSSKVRGCSEQHARATPALQSDARCSVSMNEMNPEMNASIIV